jgi:putative peptide zinc metalloprotease protein
VTELKPWVRRVVTAYVLVLVPVIAFIFLMLLINAPRVLATGWDSFWLHWDRVGPDLAAGQTGRGAMSVFQMIVLVLPAAGLVYSTGRVGHRAGSLGWRWSDGSPRRRLTLLAGTAAAVGLATFLLWPQGAYRPIQPWEKGTLLGAVQQIKDVPSGRPSLTLERERELGGAPTERQLQRQGHPRPLDVRSLQGREPWGDDPWPAPDGATPPQDPVTSPGAGPAPDGQPAQPAPSQPPEQQQPAPAEQPAPTPSEPAATPTDPPTGTAPEQPAPTETTPTETSTTPTAPP